MKKIYKAINEGLNAKLINFDSDSDFKKDRPSTMDLKKFHFGDYVYKDKKLGYNNYIGEKVAICVSDEPDQELYAVLDHPLLSNGLKWAAPNTELYNAYCENNHASGYDITQNILSKYPTLLEDTIWAKLKKDEYIPTINELKIIYNNCIQTKLWNELGLNFVSYWSSNYIHNKAWQIYYYENGVDSVKSSKWYNETYSIPLLHIK